MPRIVPPDDDASANANDPHDRLFRKVFAQPRQLGGLLRAALPAALSNRIDWSTLRITNSRLLSKQLRGREPDLVAVADLYDGGVIYFLVEHQSSPDATLAVRLMHAGVLVLEDPDTPLGAQLSFVLVHHGPRRWSHPTRIDAGEGLRSRVRVLDLARESSAKLRARDLTEQARLTLWMLKRTRNNARVAAELMAWTDSARAILDTYGKEALDPHLRYIQSVADIAPEELEPWVRAIGPDAEERIVTIAERLRQEGIALGKQEGIALGKQEGIALGKQEGIALGKQEGILLGQLQGERRLLERVMERQFGPLPETVRERLRSASTEQLERWADRVLDATSLEELLSE